MNNTNDFYPKYFMSLQYNCSQILLKQKAITPMDLSLSRESQDDDVDQELDHSGSQEMGGLDSSDMVTDNSFDAEPNASVS